MRTSVNDAAMFLHGQGLVSLSANGGSGLGIVGQVGSFTTALLLLIVIKGLLKSGKANSKPWILVTLGLMAASAFAYALDLMDDFRSVVMEVTTTVNSLGWGEATPVGFGLCIAAGLWLFPLKPVHRLLLGFLAYVTWSVSDGSFVQNISNVTDMLIHKFAG
ncbi:hypothetical protein ACFV42_23125 [Streptomyces solisilvae]|uniref:hypothetical protein n=1 Tax=Streptomyces malaysiensis TaxID=92644 RepID=UPI0036C2B858